MKTQNLSAITIYHDILTILKERGFSDMEATEKFANLISQAEMEVVEEMMEKLTDEQIASLDSMPDDVTASELAEKLKLNGAEIDVIRAKKTAKLIQELIPEISG